MEEYVPRVITFKELVKTNDWNVKVYTITKDREEDPEYGFKHVKPQLHKWLLMNNSFNATNDQMAFLIIHHATEGVFSIINWWVGKNMLNTHIFFSEHHEPDQFKLISGDGLSPCVWELEVINHERNSWIKNILKKPDHPDYTTYLEDQYNGVI